MTVNTKNWQELKKPNSLEIKAGGDPKRAHDFLKPLSGDTGGSTAHSPAADLTTWPHARTIAGPWLGETSSTVSRESASLSAKSSPTVRRSRAGTGIRLPDQFSDQRPQAQQLGRRTHNTDPAQ